METEKIAHCLSEKKTQYVLNKKYNMNLYLYLIKIVAVQGVYVTNESKLTVFTNSAITGDIE